MTNKQLTDSEKLDAILKMVTEIRQYIGSKRDCPQNLWTGERAAYEVARQRAALHPYGGWYQGTMPADPFRNLYEKQVQDTGPDKTRP